MGINSYFTIPGDFTLSLLDELLKTPSLRMVGCCNELNAGYAADGYARVSGQLGVAIVTYCVGGLSIINAAAGAYSDDLPMLIISGGPNTNDSAQRHFIHHVSILYDFILHEIKTHLNENISFLIRPLVKKIFIKVLNVSNQ